MPSPRRRSATRSTLPRRCSRGWPGVADLPEIRRDAEFRAPEIRITLRRRSIYLLPNLVTTAALFAGFYAIVQAMNARFDQSAVAIFVAMVLDGLDGRVAR